MTIRSEDGYVDEASLREIVGRPDGRPELELSLARTALKYLDRAIEFERRCYAAQDRVTELHNDLERANKIIDCIIGK